MPTSNFNKLDTYQRIIRKCEDSDELTPEIYTDLYISNHVIKQKLPNTS